MLSVLLFVVESAIIFFCIPDTGSISPTHSESAPKSSKPITTFKPRLQFHGNIGVFLSPLGSSTSSATPHDPTSFALLLYLGYLLAVEREASAVRLVMAGKQNGFDMDAIRERLRDLYG